MFPLKILLAAACLVAASGLPALAADTPPAVLPFAVAGHGAPSRACLPVEDTAALDAVAGADLPAKLADDVAKLMDARVYSHAQDAPAGSLVIVGCIQKAEARNAAKRLIGLGM